MVTDILNVKKFLHNIKASSAGPDAIQLIIFKNLIDESAYPLSKIFAKSLSTSNIRNDWLHSFVCPIYKGSGSHFTSDNNRPISLT